MGQKTRPTGFRIGITEDWRSRWYASKKEFGDLLVEDNKIRTFIKKKYLFAGIPRIVIERTRDQVIVHLHCARPGIIIGRKGQEVDRLKSELEDLMAGLRPELEAATGNWNNMQRIRRALEARFAEAQREAERFSTGVDEQISAAFRRPVPPASVESELEQLRRELGQ